MAETLVERSGGGRRPGRVVIVRDWKRRLLNELFALFIALLLLLAGGAGPARHRARPPLHRRPDRRDRDRSGLKIPDRPDRRLDLRQRQAAPCPRVRPAGRVPDLARNRPRLGPGGLARATRCRSTALTAERVDLVRLPRLKPSTGGRGRSCPASTSASASFGSTGSTLARESRARRAAGGWWASADIRSGRALIDLKALRRRRRRPAQPQARCRARPRPLRHRGAGRRARRRRRSRRWSAPSASDRASIVTRQGSWTPVARDGRARPRRTGPTLRLALGADSGRYRLHGSAAPAQFLTGRFHRLTSADRHHLGRRPLRGPGARRAASPPPRRSFGQRFAARSISPATNIATSASASICSSRAALFTDMRGQERAPGVDARRGVRHRRLFLSSDLAAGAVRRYRFRRSCAPRARAGSAPWPMRVPLRLSARAITGIGDVAGAILARPEDRGLAVGHAQADPRRQPQAHLGARSTASSRSSSTSSPAASRSPCRAR